MIRPYQITDQESLVQIFKMNIPEFFARHELKEFLDYLSDIKGTYLTVTEKGKIIGGCGYETRKEDNSGRINWIFFHPDFSGKGYGKEVVEYCHHRLTNDLHVKVFVVRTSQYAYKFFEKSGYVLVSTEKDYWGQGLDLYLMQKNKSI
ncbi:MAG: family N-acetyltransferase [Bacteroidota bacterium]|jgi:N-acetylglutamate synthase-like GNAT family acetyltransferase|nr:family N-acetyltransferase [Bacteroidota bacterium]